MPVPAPQRRQPVPRRRIACALALAAACPAASAQDRAPAGRGLTISSSLETAVTVSDSGQSSTGGSGAGRGDLALELRPGVNISSRSGRVQGSLSYSADLVQHTRRAENSDWQNFLNANLRVEAVPGSAYVDASASVTQRALSPFGRQSTPDSLSANQNRAEVGTITVSPSFQGRLGDVASLEARLNASATNTRRSKAADSTSTGGSVTLASAGRALVGWG